MFCTLEDETGIANIVIWESLLDRYRRAILVSRLMLVIGLVQKSSDNVVHVIAQSLEDRSALLSHMIEPDGSDNVTKSALHPPYRPSIDLPNSRDFH